MARPGWKTVIREFGPLAALLMGWLSVAGKVGKTGNSAYWIVALLTLPSLALVGVAAWRTWRRISTEAATPTAPAPAQSGTEPAGSAG